jgi:opacity protein-like surface antigen
VGWRIYDYSYEETSRGSPDNGDTYFGSIYRIEEDHEFFPGAFYARYSLDDHFGIGLSYDSLRAVTRDIANRGTPEEAPGDGDGTVEVTGLVLYGYGEYSFDLPLSVFAEIGVIPYSVSFDAREEWSRNGRNELSLDDSFGYFIAGGIACPIWKNLMAELFVRYTRVEVDGEWRLLGAVKDPDVNFDLSNTAYGAGLRYSF